MGDTRAFITNISFPKSFDEVLYFMNVRGKLDMEDPIESSHVEWTAFGDAEIGDEVFSMHAVTSIDAIKRPKRKLDKSKTAFRKIITLCWKTLKKEPFSATIHMAQWYSLLGKPATISPRTPLRETMDCTGTVSTTALFPHPL